MTLRGFERYAFRIVLDRETGFLEHAATTIDRLDVKVSMPGLPPDDAPKVKITRDVRIERRD